MEEIFRSSFDYIAVVMVPIICFTIVALADEIFILIKRAVMAGKTRSRRR